VFTLTFARERQVFTQKIGQRSARAMSPVGTKRTTSDVRSSVAIGGIADMAATSADFRV
jgi:hypothetical protein